MNFVELYSRRDLSSEAMCLNIAAMRRLRHVMTVLEAEICTSFETKRISLKQAFLDGKPVFVSPITGSVFISDVNGELTCLGVGRMTGRLLRSKEGFQ